MAHVREDLFPWEMNNDSQKAVVWGRTAHEINLSVKAPDEGYRLTRGVWSTRSASDAVDTGLAGVDSCVVSFLDDPTLGPQVVTCVFDQSSGTIQIKTWRVQTSGPTATPATIFAKRVAWVAIGT